MDTATDLEFLNLIGAQLDRFTRQSGGVYRCRCPFCGDSIKNKYKTRCYIYPKDHHLVFFCHNCNETGNLYKLIKQIDPSLANEYAVRNFVAKGKYQSKEEVKFNYTPVLPVMTSNQISLPKISEMVDSHPAKRYVLERKIPEKYHSDLYYSENFQRSVKAIAPNVEKDIAEEERIVIPLRNKEGTLTGIIGRAIGHSRAKYVAVQIIEEPLGWNLDKVDYNIPVIIVEGAFDAMFLENAVAALTSKLWKLKIENSYLVFDNEPRNPEIVNTIATAIEKGRNVFIWPAKYESYKDINDMIKGGFDPSMIQQDIYNHTYSGLRAMLEFNKWRKV